MTSYAEFIAFYKGRRAAEDALCNFYSHSMATVFLLKKLVDSK